jgi:hypothetical protein
MFISIFTILMVGNVSAAPLSSGNSTIYVSPTGNDANTGLTPSTAVQTISTGIGLVNDGGTVQLASGIYNKTSANGNDVNIDISKNVIISGSSLDDTIIDALNNSQIFHIDSGNTVLIKNIGFIEGKLQNSGGAISNDGTLTVSNCLFADNTADNEVGGALFTHTNLTVTDCLFINNKANSGSAIFNKGGFLTANNNVFEGNIAATDLVQYSGGTINNYAGTYNITTNVFIGNTGSAIHVDNYIPQGGIPTGLTSFTFNYIIGNTYGIYLEPFEGQTPTIGDFRINATNNWWGNNSNPKNYPTDIAGDVNNVLANTWLVFTLQAPINTMPIGESVQIIADITHNNLGQDISNIGHIQDGIPVYFTSDNGDVGTLTETPSIINGLVNAVFTADQGTGIANISVFMFGSLVAASTQVMITAVTPPINPPVKPGYIVVKTHGIIPKNDPTIGSIGMKDTGVPLDGLLLAILMVLGGFAVQKKQTKYLNPFPFFKIF